MAITVGVYKCGRLLGTGSQTTTSIASYSGDAPVDGRNVQIHITEAGNTLGRSYSTRVMSGSGTATLVVKDPVPFAAA